MTDVIQCKRVEVDSDMAIALITELNAELSAVYPEERANHFRLDKAETQPGNGAFIIAFDGDVPLGCGAVRRRLDAPAPYSPGGEIKRMYVRDQYRRRGVAACVLASLEQEASKLGLEHLLLETGTRQAAAVGLYERAGFVVIPNFGEYAESPLSLCMAKTL
tara:strand:- start:1729 stop:2214 length:486 start_codon:yes stop_codon:yes gene_type:complete